MTLQESLNKLKAKIEGGMPKAYVDIMHQSTTDLENSGIGDSILKVGDKAPSFLLPNQNGESISSEELLSKGMLLVTFYRGVWCPYCNTDLANLKRYKKQLEELGISMLSISPQLPEYNNRIIQQQRLNYDLLSDARNEVAKQFGLRWEMVDPLKSLYRDKFNIRLPQYNGDDSWTLPVPARFVIDQQGIIRYAEYSVDYTQRPNPDVVIEAMRAVLVK